MSSSYNIQKLLREETLKKEGQLSFSEKGKLLNQGQSTVFLSPPDFAYFFTLYETVGRHLKALAKSKNVLNVLELGCGTGWGAYHLANQFPSVNFTATNVDKSSVDYASQIYAKNNLKFSIADALNQKVFENKFDVVYFIELFEHFDQKDRIKLIKESLSSVKNSGLVLFSTPSREFTYGLPTPGWTDHQIEYSSSQELREFTSQFSDVKINSITANDTWRRRLMAWAMFPFLIVAHILKSFDIDIPLIRLILEKRVPLRSEPPKEIPKFRYLKETQNKPNRQTVAYFCVLNKA